LSLQQSVNDAVVIAPRLNSVEIPSATQQTVAQREGIFFEAQNLNKTKPTQKIIKNN
jgi:hypothetical protein